MILTPILECEIKQAYHPKPLGENVQNDCLNSTQDVTTARNISVQQHTYIAGTSFYWKYDSK